MSDADNSGSKSRDASGAVIVGIGNTLMGDDGAGVFVAEELLGGELPDGVECVIGDTAGMGLIRNFVDFSRVIVVDAIDVKEQPGDIFRFDPDEAGITELRSHNVHGMGVSYLITSARMMGADPDVLIFAIQVGDVRPLDRKLSEPVRKAVKRVTEMVREELALPTE